MEKHLNLHSVFLTGLLPQSRDRRHQKQIWYEKSKFVDLRECKFVSKKQIYPFFWFVWSGGRFDTGLRLSKIQRNDYPLFVHHHPSCQPANAYDGFRQVQGHHIPDTGSRLILPNAKSHKEIPGTISSHHAWNQALQICYTSTGSQNLLETKSKKEYEQSATAVTSLPICRRWYLP